MNFWETYRNATLDLNKWWRYYRASEQNVKHNVYITLPEFSVQTPAWLGSSYITTEFRLVTALDGYFVLHRKKLIPPSDVDFCLGVRYPITNGTGLDVVRYKLWENVGERLYYPLYNGEVLPFQNLTFEIWSTSDNLQTSLSVPYNIYLSSLVTPSSYAQCCSAPSDLLDIVQQNCALFALENNSGEYDLPIVFNTCFDDTPDADDTFFRKIETDELRATEDALRVWR